jgi:hypothetical protein
MRERLSPASYRVTGGTFPAKGYNRCGMDLVIQLIAKIVVPLFFLGVAGSSIVIVISFIDDMQELLEEDED